MVSGGPVDSETLFTDHLITHHLTHLTTDHLAADRAQSGIEAQPAHEFPGMLRSGHRQNRGGGVTVAAM